MQAPDRRLVAELALIVIVKLALIFALWWTFFRTPAAADDPGRVASHVGDRLFRQQGEPHAQ